MGWQVADEIKLWISLWLVPPLSINLGLCSVPAPIPVKKFIEMTLSSSTKYGIGGNIDEMIKLFSAYNYTKQLFLDSKSTLIKEGVANYDYLIVTSTPDEDKIRERFKPDFDRTVEDIRNGG